MADTNTTAPAVKRITIPEFKSWLEGVMELQAEDWAPNAEQWKKIKTRIFSLEGFDAQFERHVLVMLNKALQNFRGPVNPYEMVGPVGGASGAPFPTAVAPAMPGSSSLAPQQQPQVASPAAFQTMPGTVGVPAGAVPGASGIAGVDPSKPIVQIEAAQTPTIDTSQGYNPAKHSPFV